MTSFKSFDAGRSDSHFRFGVLPSSTEVKLGVVQFIGQRPGMSVLLIGFIRLERCVLFGEIKHRTFLGYN